MYRTIFDFFKEEGDMMRTVNDPRLVSYFTNYYDGSVARYSSFAMKILDIREHINSLFHQGDFTGVDGIIRGVLYTSDHNFCRAMIVWKSKCWEQDRSNSNS